MSNGTSGTTTTGTQALPTPTVRLDGAQLPPEAQRDLIAIRVDHDLDAIGMLTLELRNWDAATQRHTWSDSPLLAIGTGIEVWLGGYRPGAPSAFLGEVTGIEPVWEPDSSPTVTVRAYDFLHRLTRASVTRTFVDATDSDIAGRLAREAGLRARVTATGTRHRHVLQSNQTDLEFLRSRARRHGFEVFVRDRELHFREPAVGAPVTGVLRVGDEIEHFAAWLSAAGRAGRATVRAWDPRAKQAVVGSQDSAVLPAMGGATGGQRQADTVFGRATVTTADVPVRTRREADELALGRLRTSALTYVEAEAEGGGALASVRAGTTVGVQGAGTRFSGTYYVARVEHTFAYDNRFHALCLLRRTSA